VILDKGESFTVYSAKNNKSWNDEKETPSLAGFVGMHSFLRYPRARSGGQMTDALAGKQAAFLPPPGLSPEESRILI
jgi:hypothetical protein